MHDDTELRHLILLLISTSEKFKGRPVDNRLFFAGGIYLRFVNYCISVYNLLKGVDSPVFYGNKFLDPGSINSLCRSALESFLVFQYVFIMPKGSSEADLRFDVWLKYGLNIRTKIKPITEDGLVGREWTQNEINKIINRIRENIYFNTLDPKLQKAIVECKDWRLPKLSCRGKIRRDSYADIAIEAGFPEDVAHTNYEFLSGYSHSGSLSVSQILQAVTEDDKEVVCDSSITLLKILMPIMANSYLKLFT